MKLNKNLFTHLLILIFFSFGFSQLVFSSEGMSAFTRKEYNEAYRIWSSNPDTPEANYGIGRIVLEGLGSAPKNSEKGFNLINKAASSGYRPALTFLADYYERTGNFNQAIKYLDRLSDKKDLQIEQKILTILSKIQKNDPSSSKQFCEKLISIENLGGETKKIETAACAVKGNPSNMAKEEAIEFLSNSASESYAKLEFSDAQRIWNLIPERIDSLYGLGILNLDGNGGIAKNIEKGLAYLDKASSGGHKDSSKRLAQFYEKNNNNEKALFYLNKACDAKDIACKKLQVEIYGKNSTTLTKDHCENLRIAKYPEGSSEYTNYLTCSYIGIISDLNKEDAGKKLKNQLLLSPTISGLIKLGPDLLNNNSPLYDLSSFENILWKVDPDLKNSEIQSFIKSSKINDESISDMPSFTDEQKSARISASLIAAISGNVKKAFYVGKYYSSNSSFDKSNISKAKSILNILQNEKDTIDFKKIQLNIYRAESNNKMHLNLLSEIVKVEKKDEKFLSDNFNYQYLQANKFITNNSPEFRLDMVLQLSNTILQTEINNLQSSGLFIIQQLEKKYSSSIDKNDEMDIKKEEKLKDVRIIIDQLLKKGIQPSKNVLSQERNEKIIIDSLVESREDYKNLNKKKSTNNQELKDQPLAGNIISENQYSKFKYECDQNSSQSCVSAAEILLGKNIPDDFKKTSGETRRDIAIRLLEKASGFGDIKASVLLYDTLDKDLSADSKEKVNKLLSQKNFYSSTSGQLRKYARELKFDPLKTTANLIINRKELENKCNEIELIRTKILNDKDSEIAADLLSGFVCSTIRRTQ